MRGSRQTRWTRALHGDGGSSPVEFILVGTLLTALTLGVLQLALVVYVRNVVHDAAVEGAYVAALADTTLTDGAQATRDAIARAVGDQYAGDIRVARADVDGRSSIRVQVSTVLPVIGLLGIPRGVQVFAEAPEETFDE